MALTITSETLLVSLLPVVGQSKAFMIQSYSTIQSVGLGMLAITMVLSVMYLVKNMAERKAANTPEGDLIAKGLVKGKDGRRPPTLQRDLLAPMWFALFPFVVVTPILIVLDNLQTGLIAGGGATLLGLFTWWLIPRMPASDVIFDAGYRVTLIALPVIVVSLILGYLLSYNLNIPLWADALSEYVSLGGVVIYIFFLILGRIPRFRGEPATYLSITGFFLIFVGLIVNTIAT